MATAVFCIANSNSQAERIVNELKEAGFTYNDISVLFPDTGGPRHLAHEQHTNAPEDAEAKQYEGRVKSGSILISVHTENRAELERARGILECSGAQDIATASGRSAYDTGKTHRQR